jgi:hypothetical protein
MLVLSSLVYSTLKFDVGKYLFIYLFALIIIDVETLRIFQFAGLDFDHYASRPHIL